MTLPGSLLGCALLVFLSVLWVRWAVVDVVLGNRANRRFRAAFLLDDVADLRAILSPYGMDIDERVISSNYDLIRSLDAVMVRVSLRLSMDDRWRVMRALRQPSIIGRARYIKATYEEIR